MVKDRLTNLKLKRMGEIIWDNEQIPQKEMCLVHIRKDGRMGHVCTFYPMGSYAAPVDCCVQLISEGGSIVYCRWNWARQFFCHMPKENQPYEPEPEEEFMAAMESDAPKQHPYMTPVGGFAE